MREITCEILKRSTADYRLIDVRTPEEYIGELGHIETSELRPLGEELVEYLKQLDRRTKIVFVCRSGARSGQVTLLSEEMGFSQTFNMVGGMLRWNQLGYDIKKDLKK